MQSPPGHTDYTILKKPAPWVGKGLFLGTPPNFADSFLFSFVTRIGETWASTSLSLSLSHVFLQRSSGNQMIQMHVNKRVHLMSSVNFLLISCITLRTGTGVALTSWSCKAVDSHVGFHWIWGKHLTRLWMSLPWGHCGATDLLSGVAGTGGTRIYGWTNICPYQVQSFFSPVLCHSFVK